MGKRYVILALGADGNREVHPMKRWLRHRPEVAGPEVDPRRLTSRQVRAALRRRGWRIEETEDEVRFYAPASGEVASTISGVSPVSLPDRTSCVGEQAWVETIAQLLRAEFAREQPHLEVRTGYRLPYSRVTQSYLGDAPADDSQMRYETDLLVVERTGDRWTPRVVVEAKLGSVTTHDIITYSQKAASHRAVHPYLRYGIFLGGRGRNRLPRRLFRHGIQFDFMLTWSGLEPSPPELADLQHVLLEEVRASHTIQGLVFGSSGRAGAGYVVFHRPVTVR